MPPAYIAPEFRIANYAEACLWVCLGVVAFVRMRRGGAPRAGLRAFVLAAALLAFGGSDVVEAHTGTWWRPWWLLVWKGACLAVFLGVLVDQLRAKRRSPS